MWPRPARAWISPGTRGKSRPRAGPIANELAKMLINAAEGEERERVLEAIAGFAAATTEDVREGVQAFRDKRKPDFKDAEASRETSHDPPFSFCSGSAMT